MAEDTFVVTDTVPTTLDGAAEAIETMAVRFRFEVVPLLEAVTGISDVVGGFLREAVASADEVNLLVDYGRDAVERLAGDVDPVMVEYYDELVAGSQQVDLLAAHLALLVDELEAAAGRGEEWALDEIATLCRSGDSTQRWLLSLSSAPEAILRLAHRVGAAEALRDAVSPTCAHLGQIARATRRPEMFALALDLLAHLAADPDHGDAARSALLDLAGFVETAGEAVVRLPIHLLDEADRDRLVAVHEARVTLFADDPVQIPLSLDILRDNRVVRAAIWQAFDARHIT